jgi:hypothetical protein
MPTVFANLERVATGASGDPPDGAAAGAPGLQLRRQSAREVNCPRVSRKINGIQWGISANGDLTNKNRDWTKKIGI